MKLAHLWCIDCERAIRLTLNAKHDVWEGFMVKQFLAKTSNVLGLMHHLAYHNICKDLIVLHFKNTLGNEGAFMWTFALSDPALSWTAKTTVETKQAWIWTGYHHPFAWSFQRPSHISHMKDTSPPSIKWNRASLPTMIMFNSNGGWNKYISQLLLRGVILLSCAIGVHSSSVILYQIQNRLLQRDDLGLFC